MSTRTTFGILIVGAVLLLGISLAFYPRMEQTVAVHWGENGQADGFGTRFEGAFLLPLIAVGMSLLLLVVPAIDPLKANIQLFRTGYNSFILAFFGFMAYLHGLTLIYNLAAPFNMNYYLLPALGLLLYASGVLVGQAKRNYLIGIRTPWTLNNERVWDLTHKRGALVFKLAGVVTLLTVFVPRFTLSVMLVSLLGASLYIVVYSYVVFRRETQPG